MKLLIKNGLVFDGTETSKKDILIIDEAIAQISESIDIDAEIIDADGNYIVPGLIDLNCNICDPGHEHREDIRSVSRSSAKGGFTTITCQPNTDPFIDNKTMVNYVKEKSKRNSIINILPYGCMTKGRAGIEIAEIGEMVRAGIVAISDGGTSIQDAGLMHNIFAYASMFNIPVITSCDDKNLSDDGVMNKGHMSVKIGLKGIPREAEEIIVARNILLAANTNKRLHITSISTKGAVDLIRHAKRHGYCITCDTCPHYFTLTEEIVENYNTLAKVKPPLRTQDDVQGIIEGLLDGTIDAISTGHSPQTRESKYFEFGRAYYGISSLETAFPLSYTTLVDSGLMDLNTLIEKLSGNPAKILNLNRKGRIVEGYDADILILDKDKSYEVKAAVFASKAKYSPYDGQTVKGAILYTLVNGQIVYML